MDRRIFYKNFGRLLILGGLTGATGYLVANRQTTASGVCAIATHCKGCSKLSACSEEQAKEYRGKTDTDAQPHNQRNEMSNIWPRI